MPGPAEFRSPSTLPSGAADSSAPREYPGARPPSVSFEFFPPTDPEMEQLLWTTVAELEGLRPTFVSVTYGADGSTRDRTVEVVRRLQRDTALRIAPHITSSGGSREALLELVGEYWRSGVRHLVALRGDAPASATDATRSPFAYERGIDLVRALRSVADFDIAVAAYPEVHPEATSAREDLDNLKRKVDAGATQGITQFFFDNDAYLRFRDACAVAGIAVPIVPGILPINRFAQVQRFARRCGASIPKELVKRYDGVEESAEAQAAVGAAVAIDQVRYLRARGVERFHFYTLNRAHLTRTCCEALGIGSRAASA